MSNKLTMSLSLDRIHAITSDYCTQEDLKDIEVNSDEAAVDIRVFNLMESMYPGKKIVAQKIKGESVYDLIKSKQGTGKKGRSDLTLFNYFENKSIDILIENKFDETKTNPIEEAIGYCNDINASGIFTCRVAIGFNPYDSCQVITKILSKEGNWEDLVINGNVINGFIGQEILQLIYSHAGITEFDLVVKEEPKFTRAEFRRILDTDLPTIFRGMSDIASDNSLKISFTVAFISLKIILEKQESLGNPVKDESGKFVLWKDNNTKVDSATVNALRNVSDIKNAVNAITSDTAEPDLKEKYRYIFQLQENLTFNDLIDKIRKTETKNKIEQVNSSINKIKVALDKVKSQTTYSYDFDLFGEVYEALADKKTKEELGQYFTKRHIIRPIINIMFKPSDLEEIISEYKSICDPFCGTGGMLTESFKHIRTYCEDKYPNLNTSELANKIIFGYDIIDLNVSKTKINMTLADDGYSLIDSIDSLTTLKTPNKFDYIVTNVPYGDGHKAGIVKNLYEVETENKTDERTIIVNRVKKFEKDNNTQKLEYNAFIKVVQLLKEGGKAVVIIPDGLLENHSYSNMREWFIVKCKIESIISLPKWAFAPYAKEKTYAITFTKRRTDNPEDLIETINDIDIDEKFYAYIIDNDGYANSDKQYETNLEDDNGKPLHNELSNYIDKFGNFHPSIMEQTFKSKREDMEEHFDEWGNRIVGKKYGHIYLRDILKDCYYKSEKETESNKVYRLNLLPEKYFRPEQFKNLTYEELVSVRKSIEQELRNLFGGDVDA